MIHTIERHPCACPSASYAPDDGQPGRISGRKQRLGIPLQVSVGLQGKVKSQPGKKYKQLIFNDIQTRQVPRRLCASRFGSGRTDTASRLHHGKQRTTDGEIVKAPVKGVKGMKRTFLSIVCSGSGTGDNVRGIKEQTLSKKDLNKK